MPETRIRLELSQKAAEKLLKGFHEKDPKLMAMLKDSGFDLTGMELVHPNTTPAPEGSAKCS